MAQTKRRRERVAERLEWLTNYKSDKSCSHCNNKYHPVCMDFHHTNPEEKDGEIYRMIKDCASMQRIQEEIDKCILLCSNCHRVEHLTSS